MELLGADTHLRPQPELPPIGEARAGVDVDAGCVHFVQEPHGVGVFLGDDGLGMPRAVAVDVLQSLIDRFDHLDGGNQRQVLLAPILVGGGHDLERRRTL